MILTEPGYQISGGLGGPLSGRVGGDARGTHSATGDLDDEKDLEPAEQGGVDAREVGSQDGFQCSTGGVAATQSAPDPTLRANLNFIGQLKPVFRCIQCHVEVLEEPLLTQQPRRRIPIMNEPKVKVKCNASYHHLDILHQKALSLHATYPDLLGSAAIRRDPEKICPLAG